MNAKLPFSGASPRDPAIDIARLICIFCVVYVHGGTGHPMEITRALPFRDSYAYWILVEGLGRSSVPLLSIISGDRKSVVWGKSVSVRVDLGGRRVIKKK